MVVAIEFPAIEVLEMEYVSMGITTATLACCYFSFNKLPLLNFHLMYLQFLFNYDVEHVFLDFL